MKIADAGAKLSRFGAAVVLVMMGIFSLILTVDAYLQTAYVSTANAAGELSELYQDNIFLNFLLLVMLLSSLFLVYRHSSGMKLYRAELLLMVWVAVFGIAFIISTKLSAPWYTDSFIVTNAAQKAAVGDYSVFDNYFRRFPFQLGFVLYQELCFRAMQLVLPQLPQGYYCLALQVLNLVWLMLGYHALISLTGYLFQSKRVQKLMVIMLFACLPPIISCTFLYGNIPAFSLGLLGLWMFAAFIRKGRLYQGLLCALFLGLAVALKLNLLIFFVAVAIVWVLLLLRSWNLKSFVCLAVTAVSVFSLGHCAQPIYERRAGIRLGDGIPMLAWMAMGMDQGYAGPGWYSEEHTVKAFASTGMDPQATAELAKDSIAESLKAFSQDPGSAAGFFGRKLLTQWNEPSYESLWINQVNGSYGEKGPLWDLICGSGAKRSIALMDQFQQIVFLGLSLSCIYMWRRKELFHCLPLIIILGGILYHLLFEAKSQYALPYFVLMLPMAANGFTRMFSNIECIRFKEK